jgi:CheY-like chemotaxis protein
VHGDPGMLEQVLLNLTVNARDAMLNGGEIAVTLTQVTFNPEPMLPPPARPGDFIRLSVRDTGKGIAPELLPRIFEPFFTTKDVGKGTGLGLATVHGIVEQHHGWIEVESAPGSGTTFHVYLPRLTVSAQIPASSPDARTVPGGSETILLVEDEMALRLLAARVLERYGYRVITAANGVEARQIWERNKLAVDLLLTDIVMPQGISGRQLAEQLQAERPQLKVIYMSGYPGDVAGRGLDLREGVNYLKKPFGLIALAEVVRRTLDEPLQGTV